MRCSCQLRRAVVHFFDLVTYRIAGHGSDCHNLVSFAIPRSELEFFWITVNENVVPLAGLARAALMNIIGYLSRLAQIEIKQKLT